MEIEDIITNFYSNMFTTQNPTLDDIQNISTLIEPTVSQDMNARSVAPFAKDEVRKTIFDINTSKAPGPDRFTTLFFQDAWEIVHNEISSAALRVLN